MKELSFFKSLAIARKHMIEGIPIKIASKLDF